MLEPHRSPSPFQGSSDAHRVRLASGPTLVSELDRVGVLSGLKDTIQAGNHRLDTLLECITEAAMNLTGASGAAVAMWKNGAMVCRARSGDVAPPLGASLSAEAGISGACLRTGEIQICDDTESDERIDREVCRQLGLRAMAVLPVVGWHGINGIVEVFSTTPRSFSEEQITWLKQLAALAEKARALQPHTASSAVQKPDENLVLDPVAASDGFLDVVLALVDRRRRPLVFGGAGVLVMALLGLAIWLGTRTSDEVEPKAKTKSTAAVEPAGPPSPAEPGSISAPSLAPAIPVKPSAGTPVTLAAKLERIPASRSKGNLPQEVASEPVRIERTPIPVPEAEVVEAPKLGADAADSTSLGGVLNTTAVMPALTTPVSSGVSNGRVLRKVLPAYPRQALMMRLQGAVRLEAVVTTSGSLEDVKAVEGPPTLAAAAIEAVKQWRYQPYELNGKPVSRATSIIITFKLP